MAPARTQAARRARIAKLSPSASNNGGSSSSTMTITETLTVTTAKTMPSPPSPSQRRRRTRSSMSLFSWHEVEAWQRDNEYLLGRYRRISGSYRRSLRSLFYLHNQTGNIYTHLVPALLFVAYYFIEVSSMLATRYPTADTHDLLAFGVFIGSAVACFACSAAFHTLGNHSSSVYQAWLRMDLYGILLLVIGTVYSGTYYGFYCELQHWRIYSIGIVAIVSAAGLFLALPQFRTPKWRWARALLFVAVGCSGAFPMTHAAQAFGIPQAHLQMGWWYFIAEGLSYVLGAFIYAIRFPERLKPGLFDVWGCSHQIFHLAAVAGASWHLVGLLQAFDYNHDPATRRCHR